MSKVIFLATCVVLALAAGAVSAQTAMGIVTGKIVDVKSGEELIGANVLLVGTALGASADMDGSFTIRAVPAGTYDLRVSYVGYETLVVKGVVVRAGQTTKIDVPLAEEQLEKAKEEVVVTAERVLATEAAVLSERKKAATIGDAISAEQIKRSPDATSGDALKRVTGLSIVDNKFVFIRGVTDRYNGTSLNGVSVTSTDTDVDRKSFSFDLVPANLLENTVVVKTASPDLPGDFSGGLVQVNTLDFPSTRVARISLSTSYDTETTTRSMLASPGGGRDWLGSDDGSRELPANLTGLALVQALPNSWATHSRRAPFNGSLNASLGDRRALGDNEFGYVAALSYRAGYQTSALTERPTYQGYPLFSWDGARYQRNVLWGGLLNVNFKLGGLSKLSLKNNYNQSAEEKVSITEGIPISGEFTRKQTIEWDERTLWLKHLSGEHKAPALGDLEAAWRLFTSTSDAEEPDRKQVEFERDAYGNFTLKDNYRTWSALEEDARGAGLDLTLPWGHGKLKAGGLLENRERSYGIRAFTTDPSALTPANYGLLALPVEQIFAPENYGPEKFRFLPVTVFTGEYDGDFDLQAAYAMVDAPLRLGAKQLRLVAGARIEDAVITVDSVDQLGDAQTDRAELAKTDLLPSANVTLTIDERTNLRAAYGRAVNRPEFRELADVLYYDFDNVQNVRGNPDLARAVVDNYDVRLEWFPNVGEVLAGSLFYKNLTDAIEERLIPSPERFVRTWFNSPEGKNYGWELEARKSLGFLSGSLRNLSITGNYTRVLSAIAYTETFTDETGAVVREDRERIMQGQSPWTVNVSLLFADPARGTAVNVLYGKVGRRLDAVGDSRDEDVYEESRDLVDIAVTQKLGSRWEAKFTLKNVLGEDEELTIGPERSTFQRLDRGGVYTLQASLGL